MVSHRLPDSVEPAARRDDRLAVICAIIGFGVSAAFALVSPDGIVHFDDVTHYLYARWAWQWPAYLLDEWGRPGFTTLYALPAWFGWPACRLLSALISAAAAYLAFQIARQSGLHLAWMAVPLTFVQPLFFQLSQTTLTETPLAFYLAAAVWLAGRGAWSASAAFISVAAVTRHEAVVFLPLWVLFAWRRRVVLWRLWPLAWAPVVVNVAAVCAGVRPSIMNLFAAASSGDYGRGGWLTFFCRTLEAWGPGVTLLAFAGLGRLTADRPGRPAAARLVESPCATCMVIYFAAHTVIRALGLYDSGGYARFLVPISPLVGVAAVAGWQRLFELDVAIRRRAVIIIAGGMVLLWIAMERQLALHHDRGALAAELPELHIATWAVRISSAVTVGISIVTWMVSRRPGAARFAQPLLPAAIITMILMAAYALCHPLKPPRQADPIDEALHWLSDHGYADRPIVSAQVWIDLRTGRRRRPTEPRLSERVARAPAGALIFWEAQFAASADQGVPLSILWDDPTFQLIHRTAPLPNTTRPYLWVFEKKH